MVERAKIGKIQSTVVGHTPAAVSKIITTYNQSEERDRYASFTWQLKARRSNSGRLFIPTRALNDPQKQVYFDF